MTCIRHSGAQMTRLGSHSTEGLDVAGSGTGRRLEVDEILGYAVRKGAELGIPVPTVATCYRLLAGLDRVLRTRQV